MSKRYAIVERELLKGVCSSVDCEHFISREQAEIRALLAAPEQEPVAEVTNGGGPRGRGFSWLGNPFDLAVGTKLYAAPMPADVKEVTRDE